VKIYVADDSETERILITTILARIETEETKIFDNGLDLWFECLQDPPDIILLDLMLTSLGGLEFLTLLRSHKHWQREPVVLVVSSVEPSQIRSEVLKAGAQAYFHKPYPPDSLEAAIRSFGHRTATTQPAGREVSYRG
jgi:DNA-binding response OmpR family regulator